MQANSEAGCRTLLGNDCEYTHICPLFVYRGPSLFSNPLFPQVLSNLFAIQFQCILQSGNAIQLSL